MDADALRKLTPNDPRVTEQTTTLSTGRTYHYLVLPPPQDKPLRGTIILMHGFPDLPLGWRYQAPVIAALGLRVVIPAMLGYSRTDAPKDPAEYTFRSIAADMAALAQHVVSNRLQGDDKKDETDLPILLGGHDWGGATAWAAARLHPDVFSSVFSVCLPYMPPSPTYVPIEYVAKVHPTIGYMMSFGKPEFEEKVGRDTATIRTFFNAMYATSAAAGGYFDSHVGLDDKVLDTTLPPSKYFDEEELDHYVREYSRSGMHGPLSYYRNSRANFEADKEDAEAAGGVLKISLPSMFVMATEDPVVTEAMCENLEGRFENDNLVIKKAVAGHWALTGSARDETTEILKGWLGDVLEKLEAKKASL